MSEVTLTFTREPIRVAVSAFKGERRFDIRHYYRDDADELAPTQSGVSVKLAEAPILVGAIEAAVSGGESGQVPIEHYNPIFVKVSEFKGKTRLDIRHYYQKDGEWLPTRKGVNLPLVNGSALITACNEVLAEDAPTNTRANQVEI